jgi:hypothetical protein
MLFGATKCVRRFRQIFTRPPYYDSPTRLTSLGADPQWKVFGCFEKAVVGPIPPSCIECFMRVGWVTIVSTSLFYVIVEKLWQVDNCGWKPLIHILCLPWLEMQPGLNLCLVVGKRYAARVLCRVGAHPAGSWGPPWPEEDPARDIIPFHILLVSLFIF